MFNHGKSKDAHASGTSWFPPDKLIESIKQFPAHKIIILTHKGDEEKEMVQSAVKRFHTDRLQSQSEKNLKIDYRSGNTKNKINSFMSVMH